MAERPPTWPEVCALLAQFQQSQFPGTICVEVSLKLSTGQVIPLPFCSLPSAQQAPPASADDYRPFVPTAFQKAILAALEGKAMRKAALGAAVGDAGRLYKPGGLTELRERGLVEHHERLGFYRADAPPPQMQDGAEAE